MYGFTLHTWNSNMVSFIDKWPTAIQFLKRLTWHNGSGTRLADILVGFNLTWRFVPELSFINKSKDNLTWCNGLCTWLAHWVPYSSVMITSKGKAYHHHLLVVPSARISLTLSRRPSLSFIASGRSPELHPVSSQSCCMSVRAGRPAFARLCEGVHRITSLMTSSLLLQQCPARLVWLTSIVFVMGGRCPYSCCFVGCCLKDLFNIAHSIVL